MAKREYTATLALGGKLLPSFKGAFGAAKKTFDSFKKTAANIGKAFAPVWRGFQFALGGLAAYGLSKVFSGIFGGAEKAAKDALDRTFKLQQALKANPKLAKLSTEEIQGQVKAIQNIAGELGKVGVVHSDNYEAAARTLAIYEMGPKTIGDWLPILGDAVTATKGVQSSLEDMTAAADAVGKAIKTGQVKGLKEVGIVMDKNQAKAWAAMKPAQRMIKLQEILKQRYQGSNQEAANLDLGKIQRFENMMAGFSETIGLSMIPMQAKLAEFWTETLPTLEPLAEKVFQGLAKAMGDTAKFATEIVVPGLKSIQKFFESPELSKATKDFGEAFGKLGDALKPLGEAFGFSLGEGQNWGDWLAGQILSDLETLTKIVDAAAAGIKWMGDAWNTAGDLFNAGVQAVKDAGAAMEKAFGDAVNFVKAAWENLPAAFAGAEAAIAAAITKAAEAVKAPFVEAINFIKKLWDDLVAAITGFDVGKIAGDIGAKLDPRNWFGKKAPGAQYGGIFARPTTLQVAEAGTPEAIIPLKRSERSRGLLGAAAAAIGGGAGGAGGRSFADNRSTLNFSPNINIAGGASGDTVRELDRNLRAIADDFLARWNQAQEQERRLAFS